MYLNKSISIIIILVINNISVTSDNKHMTTWVLYSWHDIEQNICSSECPNPVKIAVEQIANNKHFTQLCSDKNLFSHYQKLS